MPFAYFQMNRTQFLSSLLAMGSINTFSGFKSFTDDLIYTGSVMPTLFIGHGSPMNGIEDNEFSRTWSAMAKEIPTPKAVLVVSAHWMTRGTQITAMESPKTIHDFGGFPRELFEVQYPAKGDPILAKETQKLIKSTHVELDHDWGLDHGTWTIIRHMYPKANIPILQLSIDSGQNMTYHYDLARELADLRQKGVLIVGSGNIVHNLRMLDWGKLNAPNYAFDWAKQINQKMKDLILNNEHERLVKYESLGREALMAIPTPEHYIPLLYVLGLKGKNEKIRFFNDMAVGGSLTMTSVKIG
jgi:4,5-DOPA dioxygenase extradiol